jgi:hypothetical protein
MNVRRATRNVKTSADAVAFAARLLYQERRGARHVGRRGHVAGFAGFALNRKAEVLATAGFDSAALTCADERGRF